MLQQIADLQTITSTLSTKSAQLDVATTTLISVADQLKALVVALTGSQISPADKDALTAISTALTAVGSTLTNVVQKETDTATIDAPSN